MQALHLRLISKGIYLWLALIGLAVAIWNPKVDLPRDFRHYMFVVDITQSMNVEDMQFDNVSISRLNYTLQLLRGTIKDLPCGTKVSVALFANAEIVPLYIPIEVCDNFDILDDTLSHIEWRMAWRGSSHLRLSLLDAVKVLLLMPEPTQIIFFTDGDEAAPLNAITKVDLGPIQGSNSWLLAGVGSDKASPVPKFNSKDEVIGYWSHYAIKIEPSQIVNEDSVGKRDDSIASEPNEYYLSALREDYLKELANEVGANYARADSQENLIASLEKLPPAGHGNVPVNIGWLFAAIAGICVLTDYFAPRLANADKRYP
jgi:mxaL protein